MIRYDRLWNTMAQKGMTQYRLIKGYGFSAGQIGRLKRNMHVSTHTLETICTILGCRIENLFRMSRRMLLRRQPLLLHRKPLLFRISPRAVRTGLRSRSRKLPTKNL